MENIERIPAGVMFESDVLAFTDQLALQQRRSRSFIINMIIRTYARQQISSQQPSPSKAEKPVIAF